MANQPAENIQFAVTADGAVIVRVQGRGNHLNAVNLRRVFELTQARAQCYIFDLEGCETMDSTFMGTLAGMALTRRRCEREGIVVTNISQHVRRLLETLGLKYLIELRPEACAPSVGDFQSPDSKELSKRDRLLMMLEAHQRLVDVDNDNEIKFRGVLDSLRESLEREDGNA